MRTRCNRSPVTSEFASAFVVLTALLVLCAGSASRASAQTRPRSLGTLGGTETFANDINNAGQIVGQAATATTDHAFIWTARTGMTDLGTLAGDLVSLATAVSDTGQVVGFSSATANEDSTFRAFSWTQQGGMIDLAANANSHPLSSAAVAVSRSGQVAGYLQFAFGVFHAFSWTRSGGLIDLGTLGGTSSFAHAVNDLGEVAGDSDTANGDTHAFVWTAHHGMRDLGTFGRAIPGASSAVTAMSTTGQVVGIVTEPDGTEHAFSWTEGDGMVDLGTLGGKRTEATDVNAAGTVVGFSETADGTTHAFMWTRARGMVDLGHGAAFSINGRGEIVGDTTTNLATQPWLWVAGTRIELRPLSPGADVFADKVNDGGQVIGFNSTIAGSRAIEWTVASTVLRPTADAYVRAGAFASTNFGTSRHLDVKKGVAPDNTRRSYLQFDISDVRPGVVRLGLTGRLSTGSGVPAQVIVYAVSDAGWNERTLTWSTRPALGAVLGSLDVTGTTPESLEIDLTKFVESEQLAGRTVISIALRSSEHSSAYTRFDAREAGSSGPALVVTR